MFGSEEPILCSVSTYVPLHTPSVRIRSYSWGKSVAQQKDLLPVLLAVMSEPRKSNTPAIYVGETYIQSHIERQSLYVGVHNNSFKTYRCHSQERVWVRVGQTDSAGAERGGRDWCSPGREAVPPSSTCTPATSSPEDVWADLLSCASPAREQQYDNMIEIE